MKLLRHIATMAAAGVFAAQAASAAAPQESAQARLAARVAPFIEAVAKADHPSVAMAAYARGRAVDRDNLMLHEAYLRRMIQLGLPKIACFAARELVVLDRDNGMAWGLIGYVEGKNGNYADALSATIRAAQRIPDNPSVLHNAGQLLAWYDSELELPQLPDPVKRAMAGLREKLQANKVFSEAYQTIRQTYTERTSLGADLDKKIAAAEAEARAVETVARDLDLELRGLNDEIDQRNREIDSLNQELRYYSYRYYSYWDRLYGWYVYVPGGYGRAYRDELYRRIQREEQAVEQLKAKAQRLRREGAALVGELNLKRARLNELHDVIGKVRQRVVRRFRWDPPAVDGKITPERDTFPLPAAGESAVPVDPKIEAGQRLELARMYLRNGLPEKAVEILHALIETYPKTEAAGQAKTLLGALKPAD